MVCIDPGHPSEVSAGDVVQNGQTEVRVAWLVAHELDVILAKRGIRTCMTKKAEHQFVRNRERAEAANQAHAALMVRLHCDAGDGRGFAVYYPDRAATKDGHTGPSNAVIARSRAAAVVIDSAMRAGLWDVLENGGVRGDSKTLVGSKQGALTGSIFSEVPIVTIEMVVLSNVGDAKVSATAEGRHRIARAIADGVVKFVAPTP